MTKKGSSENVEKLRILKDLESVSKISKLCGIMPYLNLNGENLTVSKSGQIYNYALCSLIVGMSSMFCLDVLFKAHDYKISNSKHGDTEEINQTIETLFCIISYTMIIISCVHNAAKHCRTYRDIGKIDEHLEASGFDGVYKCPFIVALLVFISLGVIAVAFYYIHIRGNLTQNKQIVLITAYSLQMFLSSVFAIYLRIILKNIARRIEFANQRLENFTKDENKENWRELSNLIEIFCKFRYITENINSVAGVALLFYMGYAFYTVTNQSYLAFSILTTHVAFNQKFDSMILSIAWVIAEVTTMSVICSSCDAMSSEANTTSQILSRVYGKSKEYQNIIDKFLTKSIKQEVQFTAYGFFVIDNSTLFKIFSAVTTYLVILIQFKQLEDSKIEDQLAVQAKS